MSETTHADTPEHAGQAITALLVDNDRDFVELAATMLEREEYPLDVHTATSASEALEILADDAGIVDCIVSDYQMERMDGLELLEAVRSDHPNLPFILLTGKGSEEIASEAIRAGVTEYLQKEPGGDMYALLANRIRNAAAQYRTETALQDRVRQQEALAAIGQDALNDLDLEGLFPDAVERVAGALGVTYARVFERQPGSDGLVLRAGVGGDAGAGDLVVGSDDDTLASATVDGTTPTVVNDFEGDTRIGAPTIDDEPVVAGVGVRIGRADEVWGVLAVYATEATAFTDDDITFLQSVANVLATAIERKQIETERRESERRYRTLVEVSPNPIAVHRDGEFVYVNPAAVSLFNAESGAELLGRSLFSVVHEDDRESTRAAIERTQAGDEEPTRQERKIVAFDGELKYIETTSRRIDYEGEPAVLTIATDVTERKQYERTLNTLHETSRDLMRANSHAEIADATARTAGDILDLSAVAVYEFDDSTGALAPLAVTARTRETIGEPPTFERGEGLIWDVFSSGDAAYYPNLQEEDGVYDPSTRLRSELIIPLKTHGVLVVGSDDVDGIDETTIELIKILAANTEAALDRAQREATLRERDQELSRQNEELTKLNHINRTVREINQAVVKASTRQEIEQAVCDRLEDSDPYRFAWIGEYDESEDLIDPTAWAGVDTNYIDQLRDDHAAPEHALAGRASATQDVQVVSNLLDDPDWQARRKEALTYGYQTLVAIPLVDNERVYSVLMLHVAQSDGFTDRERAVVAELGQTIGHAIRAVERTTALLTDNRVELELHVGDSRLFFNRLSTQSGGTVDLEGLVPRTDGSVLLYLTVSGATPDDVLDLVADWTTVEAITCISENEEGDTGLFEVAMPTPDLVEILANNDGTIRSMTATDGECDLVVELPQRIDTRTLIETIEASYPETELQARRETTRTQTYHDLESELKEQLTDRQYEALRAAFYSGFFEWPRESTGETLADTLGVAPPTFHYHLRAAERKLMTSVFES